MNAMIPWLDERRAQAKERFRAKGVPHRRVEEWKYSDLRSLVDAGLLERDGTAQWSLDAQPAGVEAFDLASAEKWPDWIHENFGKIGAQAPMDAASLAYARGGVALRVARGRAVDEPVRLGISGSGHLRVLVVLEDGAQLALVETCAAGETGLRNIGYEVAVGRDAGLEHIRMAHNAPQSVHLGSMAVTVAQNARYHAHFANFGAKLSRIEAHIVLNGLGAQAHLSGANVLDGNDHADVTTHIVHMAGQTASTQLFRYVTGGHARGVYQGRITVEEGALGSDSTQSAKGLLLGDRAEIDLKPELEIFADDVKCAHGAAVGDLEPEWLFYLRARGIPEIEARNMLFRAFLEDAVSEIRNETVRGEVWRLTGTALTGMLEAAL